MLNERARQPASSDSAGAPVAAGARPLRIAFFGSSLLSAWWNGAATYYRGLIRALSERGHRVTFYEPDIFQRQANRDMEPPDWARVVVYPDDETALREKLKETADADVIVKASGVGAFDQLLEYEVLHLKRSGNAVVYWDVDAPATLERVNDNCSDPFRALIPEYDLVLTYGGGPPVVEAYKMLGARRCVPIYNALDAATHHPKERDPRYEADLVFIGNRLPDREERVEEFFFRAAELCPEKRFLLGGNGWQEREVPANVERLGHVYTRDHNVINASARCVLNISRASMARFGYSPATRVFEAAGAGACLITDAWRGVDHFFEPDEEILVAENGEDVAELLSSLSSARAAAIGQAALKRVRAEHTYARRAEQTEALLTEQLQ